MIGASAVQKQSLANVLQNRCQACNFIKRRLPHRCFPMKFTKSLKTPFLQKTSTLVASSGAKQCKPIKTYTESLCCREINDITWTVVLRLVFLDNERLVTLPEAVVQGCSVKKVFLKILQIKVACLWILRNFQEQLFS